MAGQKNADNTQFALVGASGTRPVPLPDNDGIEPLADEHGRMFVRPIGAAPPVPEFFVAWQNHTTPALDPLGVVFTGVSSLSQITGFVEATDEDAIHYVQVYDATVAPGPADVPVQSLRVVGSQVFAWAPEQYTFGLGIRVAVSTTAIGYTNAGSATLWFNALGWSP